jgi:type 1 glutamine amidotransferase
MKRNIKKLTILTAMGLCSLCLAQEVKNHEAKNILLIAGKPSHGRGAHEHNAGALLLKKCLDESALPVTSSVIQNGGWPTPQQLAAADTVLIYCDGGPHHLLLEGDRMQQLAREMKRGCGLLCLHYGVEIPKENGGPELLQWTGGYFETHWSVNPHWTADFKEFPKHPVSNGLKPYAMLDEWYFHMRFAEQGQLTHVLSATAPASTMQRPDGPHSGNPHVRKAVAEGLPQTVAWAFERPDGGRGFGFTGGHFHKNWGDDNQRKVVLNAILWTAKAEVPAAGVPSAVTAEELEQNLDPIGPRAKPSAAAPLPDASADPAYCAACNHLVPAR